MDAPKDGQPREFQVAAVKKDLTSIDLAWELTPIIVKDMSTGFFAMAQTPQ